MTKQEMIKELQDMKLDLHEMLKEAEEESNPQTRKYIIINTVEDVIGKIRLLEHKISNL
ncbi:MAG: hypothetical protein ACLFPS_09690 [Clostridia bacterium]